MLPLQLYPPLPQFKELLLNLDLLDLQLLHLNFNIDIFLLVQPEVIPHQLLWIIPINIHFTILELLLDKSNQFENNLLMLLDL